MFDVTFFLKALGTDIFMHKVAHFLTGEEACVWIDPYFLD
jgi:hypothetical protein